MTYYHIIDSNKLEDIRKNGLSNEKIYLSNEKEIDNMYNKKFVHFWSNNAHLFEFNDDVDVTKKKLHDLLIILEIDVENYIVEKINDNNFYILGHVESKDIYVTDKYRLIKSIEYLKDVDYKLTDFEIDNLIEKYSKNT